MSNPDSKKLWEEAINQRWDQVSRLQESIQKTLEEIKRIVEPDVHRVVTDKVRCLIKHPKSIKNRNKEEIWYTKTYEKIPADPAQIPTALLRQLANNSKTNPMRPGPYQLYVSHPAQCDRDAAMLEVANDPALLAHLRLVDSNRRAQHRQSS